MLVIIACCYHNGCRQYHSIEYDIDMKSRGRKTGASRVSPQLEQPVGTNPSFAIITDGK